MADVKLTVTKEKEYDGKQTGRWIAKLGGFYEYGATKEEAKKNFEEAFEWYFLDIDLSGIHKQTKKNFFTLRRSFHGYWVERTPIGDNSITYSGPLLGRLDSNAADIEFKKAIDSQVENNGDSYL